MMSKSYDKGCFSIAVECEQAGLTGDRARWRAGHKQGGERSCFSWINSTWQRWHLQRGSKHCATAVRERMRGGGGPSPLTMSLLQWFSFFSSFFGSFLLPLFILYRLTVFLCLFVSPMHLFHCTTEYLQMSLLLSFYFLTLLCFPSLRPPLYIFLFLFPPLFVFLLSTPPSVSLSVCYSSALCERLQGAL